MTETWFFDCEIVSLKLNNYILTDYYCRVDKDGGGVAIYIKQDICKYNIIHLHVGKLQSHFEYSVLKISKHSVKILVICLYRTHDSDVYLFLDSLENLLSKICYATTISG